MQKELILRLKPPHGVRRAHERTFRLYRPEDLSELVKSWGLECPPTDQWDQALFDACDDVHYVQYQRHVELPLLEELFRMFGVDQALPLHECVYLTLWFSDGSDRTYALVLHWAANERWRREHHPKARSVTGGDLVV